MAFYYAPVCHVAIGDTLRFDKAYWYACVPVFGAFMTVYTFAGLVRAARGEEEETITNSMG